jgi:type II secretory pathway pseudopilin PulG
MRIGMEQANSGSVSVQNGAKEQPTFSSISGFRGNPPQRRAAFTLPELLVIIGVIALLALVWLPAHASLGRKAGLLECKNNLRQAGWAIDMYTRDHQDYLPGPIWTGVFYNYSLSGSGSMASYLRSYFGLPAPASYQQEVEALKCAASVQAQPQQTPSPPLMVPICFISCTWVTNSPGTVPGDVVTYPFGHLYPPDAPTVKIGRIRRPSEQWSMMDVDQQLLNYLGITSATYYSYLPTLPVHNNRPGGLTAPVLRNALYFDGTVRGVSSAY